MMPPKKKSVKKAGKKPPKIDWDAVWKPMAGLRRIYPYPVMWAKLRAKVRENVEAQLRTK